MHTGIQHLIINWLIFYEFSSWIIKEFYKHSWLVYTINICVITMGILHKFWRICKKCLRELSQFPQPFLTNRPTSKRIICLSKFLRVNHYDFMALHSMWKNFLKGYCVLVSSGNYTHVEILTGNSWEKFINYKVLRQESNLRLCDAGALLWPLSYGGSWSAAPASHRHRSIPPEDLIVG